MEPLLLLIAGFAVSLALMYRRPKKLLPLKATRLGLAFMFICTGLSHFVYARGMALMLPSYVPCRPFIIFITGIAEIVFAAGMFTPFKKSIGIASIVFLIAVLPSNIYAAFHRVNIVTAQYDGEGPLSLWYRIPVQLVLAGCIYWALIKNNDGVASHNNSSNRA